MVDDGGDEGWVEFVVDGGVAEGGGEDPADDAVLDFFVAEHGVEDVGGVDAGERVGEADGGEEVVLAGEVGLADQWPDCWARRPAPTMPMATASPCR